MVAIAGWTCTGKTRLARALGERFAGLTPVVLSQDDYYRDTSHLTRSERTVVNYDEPESYDLDVFAGHLETLRRGGKIPRFAYDFATGSRRVSGFLGPTEFAVAEGVFALWDARIREAADLRILIEGDLDRLLARRIRRDGAERAYSAEEVRRRFDTMVIPAQRRYLAGARQLTDLRLPMDWGDEWVARAAARLETLPAGLPRQHRAPSARNERDTSVLPPAVHLKGTTT